MASRKCISIGFLLLTCLSLSAAHRLLLDSFHVHKPKESGPNLARGDGRGGDVEIMGMGTGTGVGVGYGSGSGWGTGVGYGSGSGWGTGYGGGDHLGVPPFIPRVHGPKPVPIYKPMPIYKPVPIYVPTPVPDRGCQTCEPNPPVYSCPPCQCQGSGPWVGVQSHTKIATHLEPELAETKGMPTIGIMGMGTEPTHDRQTPYTPEIPPQYSCSCPCDGWVGVPYRKSAAHIEREFAARMIMPSGGSNFGANTDPLSSNASKEDQEAHQASSGNGQFKFASNDGEPQPPDSAPERNEMKDHQMMNGRH